MSTMMLIVLGLLAWVVVPLPLAILVGRLFGRDAEPVAVPVGLLPSPADSDPRVAV